MKIQLQQIRTPSWVIENIASHRFNSVRCGGFAMCTNTQTKRSKNSLPLPYCHRCCCLLLLPYAYYCSFASFVRSMFFNLCNCISVCQNKTAKYTQHRAHTQRVRTHAYIAKINNVEHTTYHVVVVGCSSWLIRKQIIRINFMANENCN